MRAVVSIDRRLGATLATAGLLLAGIGTHPARGDEPRGLGRLFRFGPASNSRPADGAAQPKAASSANLPGHNHGPLNGANAGNGNVNGQPAQLPPPPLSGGYASSLNQPASQPLPGDVGAPRIAPQPRNTRAATEADPLLTRIALGRADDGKQFGMFLQVYADGTVIDTEGVHRVGPDVLRPLAQAMQAVESSRATVHCGAPATDFIESVHVVMYERAFGRLKATSFSFSGNTQGCDPSVKQLQAAIDALQLKISPSTTAAPPTVAAGVAPADTSAPPPPIASAAPPINLTSP